ncbi:type I-E CRISPR-associated endoribonuclease Cas2e [Natronoglycomyces albus]|uniref:Type I-E CRISPR-associated endoribonuclease Cas2 n=1 Tax=Natronoglycomyces albus TaxID=2811108 RepID=A0A895XLE8_9ACTN|nr:type I-E CRISPR-associated endoribonuclease Cas2e [Natronoglycomyces albus]QSB06531.1 type I-E CRISPR-associated endoribonuclease Cas2 [Natronoglycomyces albus]
MANLVVISTTAVPDHVRGALSRWMVEPTPGFYVGTLSAKVRDELWQAVSTSVADGAATCVFPHAEQEQRFIIRTAGERHRHVIDFDGLQLIEFKAENEQTPE